MINPFKTKLKENPQLESPKINNLSFKAIKPPRPLQNFRVHNTTLFIGI